jgi:hypothetical protein
MPMILGERAGPIVPDCRMKRSKQKRKKIYMLKKKERKKDK